MSAYEPPTITDFVPTPAQAAQLDSMPESNKVVGRRGGMLFIRSARARYQALRSDGSRVPLPMVPRPRRTASGFTAAQDLALRRLFEGVEPAEMTICQRLDHLVAEVPDGRRWAISPAGNTITLAAAK